MKTRSIYIVAALMTVLHFSFPVIASTAERDQDKPDEFFSMKSCTLVSATEALKKFLTEQKKKAAVVREAREKKGGSCKGFQDFFRTLD